jgi:Na+/pantothenate symporter
MDFLTGAAYRGIILLSIMIAYTAFCLLIGQWFKRKAASGVDAFYVAKREIPGWAIALAFFSTFISTNTYIGQAGYSFKAGLSWAWVGVYWTVFCMIAWLLMSPRMRIQTTKLKSVTVPDYFDYRYQSSFTPFLATGRGTPGSLWPSATTPSD